MRNSSHRPRQRARKLGLQTLERRRLLAAEIEPVDTQFIAEDVNGDGNVSSLDALIVINRMRRSDGKANGDDLAADVNGDGGVTSLDALRIINRMQRDRDGRGGGPDGPLPPPPPEGQPVEAEIRSIDGTGNHLEDDSLGAADEAFRRLVSADYGDGLNEPSGSDRLSAREISNIISAQSESIPNDRGLSDLVWQWGQFIDHDITLTVEAGEGEEEALHIEVPTGDPYFDPFATGEQVIHFTRSGVAEGASSDAVREQINGITAWIDGSMVYGSSEEVANSLRAFSEGRLLTSEGDLLPIGEDGFFVAGDIRANEQNGLTAMHTLWVREHNRIAERIAEDHPNLNDEQIFQRARELVIAEIQAITFNEYLPALLGRDAIQRYSGYDQSIDPTISNLFASAAFRYGHTSLSGELLRLDDDGNVIEEGNLALRDAFFNPTGIIDLGIEPLLKGQASNVAQEIDTQLVDDVRNFLFGPPGAGGFDLAALNIQRGRDHGLPDYNSVREQLGLVPASTFADITSDPEVQAKLEQAYGTVDDIDVWVGALAEDHVAGGGVGELTRAVLTEQFTALRDGDRFWYENVLEGAALENIRSTRLSDVIERNTELTSIQDNAFFVPGERDGRPPRERQRDDRNDVPPMPPRMAVDGSALREDEDQMPPPSDSPEAPIRGDRLLANAPRPTELDMFSELGEGASDLVLKTTGLDAESVDQVLGAAGAMGAESASGPAGVIDR